MRRRWLLIAALAVLPVMAAPPAQARRRHAVAHKKKKVAAAKAPASNAITIRRTEHGIPHIKANDFAGAGYGFGYAFAQDDVCTMAEDYVTVDGQRSRFFGPDGSYLQRGNGFTANNLNSDAFFQDIIDRRVVENLVAQAPPKGPKQEVRDLVRGYVGGYNRYLADVGGAAGVPDPTCKGQPWVHPITEMEAYRRFYQLVLLASQDVVIDGIASASPPPPGGSSPSPAAPSADAVAKALAPLQAGAIGSNAVAVGKGGTRDHTHGLLLGNPHFPWIGPERFYQFQLTVPKKMDVSGAALFGVPIVLIGHTATMAWSHTVSTAYRFTPYQLTLVPGSPTTYLVDGKPTPMTSHTVTVQAKQSDGSLKPVTRTLWQTRYGPVFTSLSGVPLPWTPVTAFAMRDANADNFRVFNHFFDTDTATSANQELDILRRYEGIPWVNTIVSDRDGNALYADIGAIPHVTNDQAQQCNTVLGAATFQLLGLPILDGSRTACDWGTDPDSVEPGLFGASKLPHLFRDDYVTNSNDSYWLSNPHQPLEGYARIIGDERTARSLRTRIGLIMTDQQAHGSGFARQDMQDEVFSDRVYGGELTRDALVGMCRQFESFGSAPTSSGPPVPVGNACDVLAKWDVHDLNDSRGALLFRRFWSHASGAQPSPWAHPFDPKDPVNTPNTLDTNNPTVRTSLGDAISDLNGAHIALDAPLGSQSAVTRNGVRISIHGGPEDPGDFNAIYPPWIDGKGLGEPDEGSSYVQVVTWNSGPCPDAATILTYSLSANPASPYYADQTQLYSRHEWVPERFCDSAIASSPALQTTRLTP